MVEQSYAVVYRWTCGLSDDPVHKVATISFSEVLKLENSKGWNVVPLECCVVLGFVVAWGSSDQLMAAL